MNGTVEWEKLCLVKHDGLEKMLHEIDKRYEQRFQDQKNATSAALASAQLAVDKAEKQADTWRANANEWRAAMSDKDALFATKNDVTNLKEKITGLESLRDIAIGKASQQAVNRAQLASFIALLLGIIALLKQFVF